MSIDESTREQFARQFADREIMQVITLEKDFRCTKRAIIKELLSKYPGSLQELLERIEDPRWS